MEKTKIGIDGLMDTVAQIHLENLALEVYSSHGDTVELYPMHPSVRWNILSYKTQDIQQLINLILGDVSQEGVACSTTVEIQHLEHMTAEVGADYLRAYIKGEFHVSNSCDEFTSCDVKAEYLTDRFYLTQDTANARYTEAIVGIILNAVVASQLCPVNINN